MEQTKKLKTSPEFSLSDESSFFFLYQVLRLWKCISFKLFRCFQLLFFFQALENGASEERVSFLPEYSNGREKIHRDKLNKQFLELGNAFGIIFIYKKRTESFFNFMNFFFLGELFYELVKADNILQWSIIFHGHCHKFLNMRLVNADIQHINRVVWNTPWSLYYKVMNYSSQGQALFQF